MTQFHRTGSVGDIAPSPAGGAGEPKYPSLEGKRHRNRSNVEAGGGGVFGGGGVGGGGAVDTLQRQRSLERAHNTGYESESVMSQPY